MNEANPISVDRFLHEKQTFVLLTRRHSICADQLIEIGPKFMTSRQPDRCALVMNSNVIK